MRRPRTVAGLLAVGLVALGAAVGIGYVAGHRAAPASPSGASRARKIPSAPRVRVRTAPVRRGQVSEDLVLYGTVLPAAKSVHVYALPFQVVVDRLWVTPGQRVKAGAPLLDAHTSPRDVAEVRRAAQAVAAARALMKQVEARFKAKVATRDALILAKARLRQAETAFAMVAESGQTHRSHTLRALKQGVVTRAPVRAGSIASPGALLVETADRASLQVRLVAETEDAPLLHAGMTVTVRPVEANAVKPVQGRVTLVSRQVDPATRLVFVRVRLSGESKLYVNQYVRGQVRITSPPGLVVPRAALVPHGSGYQVFTIGKGRAQVHPVRLGAENPAEVQVTGPGLGAGMQVVVQGAHWLASGTRVVVTP